MRKLKKYQFQSLRQVYDFDTVMKINDNIINLINSYTKQHNLKGWKKKYFITEIKSAFFFFYKYKENDKYTSRIFQKYNILPYDNVMSFSYNIFSKFGSAYIEKRKQYLRWCDANDTAPREYKYWKQTIDTKKGNYFM
jgi:hypothetical protein|tara:strand:- start:10 stop:423 length:414 start_codon:yes stop_codon:yes gene_type:complete